MVVSEKYRVAHAKKEVQQRYNYVGTDSLFVSLIFSQLRFSNLTIMFHKFPSICDDKIVMTFTATNMMA